MPERRGGGDATALPQYLADQLILFQPGRGDHHHLLQLAPPMFFTFRHHCSEPIRVFNHKLHIFLLTSKEWIALLLKYFVFFKKRPKEKGNF